MIEYLYDKVNAIFALQKELLKELRLQNEGVNPAARQTQNTVTPHTQSIDPESTTAIEIQQMRTHCLLCVIRYATQLADGDELDLNAADTKQLCKQPRITAENILCRNRFTLKLSDSVLPSENCFLFFQ